MSSPHIEQIKNRINIVDFIGEHIVLKPSGSNYKALCPFHNEKTPSFMVSPSLQIYKCFGCGKSGDIFTFLQEKEGMPFKEALQLLADRSGIRLPHFNKETSTRENILYECMRVASRFYNLILVHKKCASDARDYLKKRGVDDLTLDTFQLGWSGEWWSALYDFLKKRNFSDAHILESGLVRRGEKGYYDMFRSRLMFPIWDIYGRVIGFGGRIIEEKSDQSKYINTPNTLIYDKSKVLYGLDKAKNYIRSAGCVVIVEGYMDVIASYMAEVRNVIAVSGTALTVQQLQLLKRFTNNIVFAFDMDQAGINAVIRSYLLALSLGMNTKVVQLAQGKDPYDIVKEDKARWQAQVTQGKHVMDYYFDVVLTSNNAATLQGKKSIRDMLVPIIQKIPDKIEQTHYAEKLATILHVRADELFKVLGDNPQEVLSKSTAESIVKKDRLYNSPLERTATLVIALISRYIHKIPLAHHLPEIFVEGESLKTLYRALYEAYNSEDVSLNDLEMWKNKHHEIVEEYLLLADKDYAELDDREIHAEFLRLIGNLNEFILKEKRDKLIAALKKAGSEDSVEVEKLTEELDQLVV